MIKIITEPEKIDLFEWEQFVLDHPHGNIFQTQIMYDIYKSVDNYQPYVFIAERNGKIVGVLLAVLLKEKGIKGFFSKRCIIWGGPLVKENTIIPILIKSLLSDVKNKCIYIEVRNFFDTSTYKAYFNQNGFKFIEWLNFILDVNKNNDPLKLLKKNRRWEIRKSKRTGAITTLAKSEDEVLKLLHILKNLYLHKIKKPLPPLEFFLNLFKLSDSKYFLVKYNNEIVGGTICLIFKDTLYEMYECGYDHIKDVYVHSLATFAPIEYSAKNNIRYFDFMGAGSPKQDYGVRKFKEKFGGQLVNYGRYIRINNTFLYHLGKLGLKFYQKLTF